MIESIVRAAAAHGDVAAIVPVYRVTDLRRDVESLKHDNALNDYQRYIVESIYQLEIPDVGFSVRSLIIVAAPSRRARVTFSWQGQDISAMIPPGYLDYTTTPVRIAQYLNDALEPPGYRVQYAPRLPQKLLAVRSGLGRYGRNNICYVEGLGSLLNLFTYYSDVPCEDGAWHALRHLDSCDACEACVRACPTGAILPDRFLIDNTRCLTCLNEAGAEQSEFPAWVPPSVHHTAYGCARCIDACPVNRPYSGVTSVEVSFDEQETGLLLQGLTLEQLPDALQAKVVALDMTHYLGALPRNLKALGIFDRSS